MNAARKQQPETERTELMNDIAATITKLTPHDLRRLSVEATADPRTVRRYLAGKPVVSTSSARIAAAIERLGLNVRPVGGGSIVTRTRPNEGKP